MMSFETLMVVSYSLIGTFPIILVFFGSQVEVVWLGRSSSVLHLAEFVLVVGLWLFILNNLSVADFRVNGGDTLNDYISWALLAWAALLILVGQPRYTNWLLRRD